MTVIFSSVATFCLIISSTSLTESAISNMLSLKRGLARLSLGAIGSLFFAQPPAYSQIPIVSEQFNINSGSKVVDRKGSNVIITASNLKEAVLQAQIEISTLKDKVSNRDWDSVLKTSKLKLLKTSYFGIADFQNIDTVKTPIDALAKYLSISLTDAKILDEKRQELSYDLGQLGDIAISKRVIFFNSDDLNGIKIIGEESGIEPSEIGNESFDEAISLANDITKEFEDIKNSIIRNL